MNIEKLIEDFVNLKIDLIDYLLKLEHLEITNKGEFQNFIINYKETTKMDEKMNALLILWFCKYELFKDIQYDSNPYLLYINDLLIFSPVQHYCPASLRQRGKQTDGEKTLLLLQGVLNLGSKAGENIVIRCSIVTTRLLLISQGDIEERHIKNLLVALASLENLGIRVDNIVNQFA